MSDGAVTENRLTRLEADVARNASRLDSVVRLEERVDTIRGDVHSLTDTLHRMAVAEEQRRANEIEQLRERREDDAKEKKADRRTMWSIAVGLFLGIVGFIVTLSQAGALH